MTIADIIAYIMHTPENTNPAVLKSLLAQFADSSQPDLSFVTATADKILKGYDGASSSATKVEGTCDFNAELPAGAFEVDDSDWGITTGKSYIIKENGEWVLKVAE